MSRALAASALIAFAASVASLYQSWSVSAELGRQRVEMERRIARLEASDLENRDALEERRRVDLDSSPDLLAQAPDGAEPSVAEARTDRSATQSLQVSSNEAASLSERLEALESRVEAVVQDPVERAYRYLESDNARLRLEGLRLLARLAAEDPEARQSLRAALSDPSAEVRVNAIEILASLEDEESIPGIVEALSDGEAEVRGMAMRALGHLGVEQVGPEIASFLTDDDIGVRVQAAAALGRLRHSSSADLLLSALEDREFEVRAHAAVALGEIGDKRALPVLRDLVARGVDDPRHGLGRGYHRYVLALDRLGDSSSINAELSRLREQVRSSESVTERVAAVRALAWLGPERSLDALRSAQKDSSERVRQIATRALEQAESASRRSP